MGTQVCRVCGECKSLKSFDKVGKKADGTFYFRKKCHTCRWPTKRRWRIGNRERMDEYKKQCKCKRCGIADFRVLDFHHRGSDKEHNIANRCQYTKWETLLVEIRKCDVLCSNCHRILHHTYRNGA